MEPVKTLVLLFLEFCRVGLFSVGGGLATIPFLTDLGERTKWFDPGDLANMIAISESTPGPMGVNMATYVGFHTGSLVGGPVLGIVGGVVSTLGLIFPSIVIILVIAGFLQKFRQSKAVDGVFYGLRAASVALITAALLQVAKIALMFHEVTGNNGTIETQLFYWPAVILAVVIFALVKYSPLKKLHPICFIGLAAVAGIIFQM
ncbi:MAG: chromate transporter [Clostridiales bacterium]|nr:chromate transporter [Clostridiales bacterium]